MRAWEQFLQQQESELGHETVKKWLRTLKVLSFDAGNLYLEAKDTFQTLWFEEHMRTKVMAELLNGNNRQIKVHLTVVNAGEIPKRKRAAPKKKEELKASQFQLSFDELDPHALFELFVIDPDNELTHQYLIESASSSPKEPSNQFNPIYLYGPTGCGKTHLLMSLAHRFRSHGLKSLYVRAELFTDHVVSAIRAGEMSAFRQAYRNADILLVDDVHVFSRKGATQEEFFHTFNTLHLGGKQIILSANCSPQELQLIEPRLVSRFEWGIVLPLQPLREEKIKTMLRMKAQAVNFNISDKTIDFLTENFTSSPKAPVKAFKALLLRHHLDNSHPPHLLSSQAMKMMLSDLLEEEQKHALTPAKVIQVIADHFVITSEDILGKSQTRERALPRQLAMHFCRDRLKLSYMKIGELFSRDHSTVMTSVKLIQKGLEEENQEILSAWYGITKRIQALC